MKKHLTQNEKRQQIKLHLKINWQASNRSVGRALGIHHTTVKSVRDEMIQSGRFSHLYTTDKGDSWKNHPYLQLDENKGLIETLNPRNLRAIKRIDVLDYMMANPQIKSPCVAQAKLAKEAIIRRKTAPVTLTEADIVIRKANVCNIEELSFVPDCGVDLCICDPPWDSTSAEVCAGIANAASAKLKDGASLLVLTGSSHLDEVITSLSSNKTIKYHWLLVCPLPQGAPASTSWLKVQSKVRLVLWYTKGKYNGEIYSDWINRPTLGNDASKTHHIWGAPEELISELITRYSNPGDYVADFTTGGGCSAVCAVKLGRKYYGSDINEKAVNTTIKRVRQLFGYTK
ncbi:DNA methyltransferase [Clostridium sp. OS1-26]|uniref:DNA methyltransferase n=1 Tax=Clostridium sp. OS1-26 TaxID=3070681 RepID=UPI0027E0CA25|nr:DNA methyltransferase [Clostridium sp. OS1-26]WML36951.1 DNA methyltransferase [Clostridium sp. OS1-26]